jgi:hypothetical protein
VQAVPASDTVSVIPPSRNYYDNLQKQPAEEDENTKEESDNTMEAPRVSPRPTSSPAATKNDELKADNSMQVFELCSSGDNVNGDSKGRYQRPRECHAGSEGISIAVTITGSKEGDQHEIRQFHQARAK